MNLRSPGPPYIAIPNVEHFTFYIFRCWRCVHLSARTSDLTWQCAGTDLVRTRSTVKCPRFVFLNIRFNFEKSNKAQDPARPLEFCNFFPQTVLFPKNWYKRPVSLFIACARRHEALSCLPIKCFIM